MAWRNDADLLKLKDPINRELLMVLDRLLQYMIDKNHDRGASFEGEKSLAVMQKHVGKGGKLRSHAIDPSDANLFEQLLKYHNVTYTSSTMTLNTGEEKVVFMTMDKDAEHVKAALNDLKFELSLGMSQMSVDEFIEHNRGMSIRTIGNLSEAEALEFRKELASQRVGYAINHTEDDKYEIMFMPKDEEIMKEVAMNVAYSFSGPTGEQYLKNVEADLNNQHLFDSKLYPNENETFLVVDSQNPNVFIAIDSTGFSTHNITQKEENNEQTGEMERSVEDNAVFHSENERSGLMNYVNQLHEPVLIKNPAEFDVIAGISAHKLTLKSPEETLQAVHAARAEMLTNSDKYIHEQVSKRLNPDKKIYTAVKLPKELIEKLSQMQAEGQLSHTAIEGNKIAYSGADRLAVDGVIWNELFKGSSDMLELNERKIKHHGGGEIDFSDPKTALKYLVDADNPKFAMRLDEHGLTVFENGVKLTEISRLDGDFRDVASKLVENFSCPVVLSDHEFESPDKFDIIASRTPQMQARDAQSFVFDVSGKELAQLQGTLVGKALGKEPSQRQAEALNKHSKYKPEATLCNDAFIERVAGQAATEQIQTNKGFSSVNVSSGLDR